jgi:hypothetical protein
VAQEAAALCTGAAGCTAGSSASAAKQQSRAGRQHDGHGSSSSGELGRHAWRRRLVRPCRHCGRLGGSLGGSGRLWRS